MRIEDLLELIDPHPELVSAMRPSAVQVAEAASVRGWLPDDEDRLFVPAAVG